MRSPTIEDYLAARKRPNSPVVMRQAWRHLLFLHWEFSPEEIQTRLPKGLYVDTFDERAFIGIVPFHMDRIRPRFCPPIPGISWFLELNLRTYVHDENGRPGVWFFTLDCNQRLAVNIARTLFHLPYHYARMSSSTDSANQLLTYKAQRPSAAIEQTFQYPAALDPIKTHLAEPDSIEFFLLERYRLFSERNGALYDGLVHHTPYEYQKIPAPPHNTALFSHCGFEEPAGVPVSSLIANTVDVDIHPLVRVKTHLA